MIAGEAAARAFVASRCDVVAMRRLERFAELLVNENMRQNLVAAASLETVWSRHIADSAQLLDHVPRETGLWLDLGTGAGFPGVVIAIMRPNKNMKLVEGRARRIDWLRSLCDQLELARCEVVGQRLEHVAPFAAGAISARAFAPLPKLLHLSARFSTDRTYWLLPKGRSAAQELSELAPNWRKRFHVEPSATDPTAGIIVGGPRAPAELEV